MYYGTIKKMISPMVRGCVSACLYRTVVIIARAVSMRRHGISSMDEKSNPPAMLGRME